MSEREPPLGEGPERPVVPDPERPGVSEPETDLAASEGETPAAVASADDSARPAPVGHDTAPNMLPGRARRGTGLERFVVRLVATGGVIGIGVGIAAILAANKVQGWIVGLVVASVSVVLSAILWSSRQM